MRRRLHLDKEGLVIIEERDGGIFLQPAMAVPLRDFSVEQMQTWIAEDEAGMEKLDPHLKGRSTKRQRRTR